MDCKDLEIIKEDINKFIEELEKNSKDKIPLTDNEKNFFKFLAKHILFFKELYRFDKSKYFLEVLISDIFSYIVSIINGEKRYIFLNERSIIENYIRYLMKEDYIKENTFDRLKEKFNLQNDIFSLIKEEYSTSCKYIHGTEILKSELLFYFLEYIKREKEIFRDFKYYKRISKMLNIYDNLILKEDEDFINGVFHRRKTLLKFLIKIN
ncbi:Apea-like HEPN domain-containing protein [Fusobacterium sp. oral taxon C10]